MESEKCWRNIWTNWLTWSLLELLIESMYPQYINIFHDKDYYLLQHLWSILNRMWWNVHFNSIRCSLWMTISFILFISYQKSQSNNYWVFQDVSKPQLPWDEWKNQMTTTPQWGLLSVWWIIEKKRWAPQYARWNDAKSRCRMPELRIFRVLNFVLVQCFNEN